MFFHSSSGPFDWAEDISPFEFCWPPPNVDEASDVDDPPPPPLTGGLSRSVRPPPPPPPGPLGGGCHNDERCWGCGYTQFKLLWASGCWRFPLTKALKDPTCISLQNWNNVRQKRQSALTCFRRLVSPFRPKMRVFHQDESCLLALSYLHNSREDGGKNGISHFDETLILIGHRGIFAHAA